MNPSLSTFLKYVFMKYVIATILSMLRASAEMDNNFCLRSEHRVGVNQIVTLYYRTKQKFESRRALISFWLKYFLRSLSAKRALLAA